MSPELIRVKRKSNSNQLAATNVALEVRRSQRVCKDTYFRARLQAWMDYVRDDWLHSGGSGCS